LPDSDEERRDITQAVEEESIPPTQEAPPSTPKVVDLSCEEDLVASDDELFVRRKVEEYEATNIKVMAMWTKWRYYLWKSMHICESRERHGLVKRLVLDARLMPRLLIPNEKEEEHVCADDEYPVRWFVDDDCQVFERPAFQVVLVTKPAGNHVILLTNNYGTEVIMTHLPKDSGYFLGTMHVDGVKANAIMDALFPGSVCKALMSAVADFVTRGRLGRIS